MYAAASFTTLRSMAVPGAPCGAAPSPPPAAPLPAGLSAGGGIGAEGVSGSPPIETGVAAPRLVAGAMAAR
jgi:hypothetical protein